MDETSINRGADLAELTPASDNNLSAEARTGRTDLDPEFARAIEPEGETSTITFTTRGDVADDIGGGSVGAGQPPLGDASEPPLGDAGVSTEGALDPGERYGQGPDLSHPESATGQAIERSDSPGDTAWKSTAGGS